MVVERGEIWWAELGEPKASEPGYRRPVLVIQSDAFNRSRIRTIVAVALTSNMRLLDAPGNVLVPAEKGGLAKDSVVNVSQLVTLDKEFLTERAGKIGRRTLQEVERGLRLVLEL
ncbi:MAG: type II toxin-antitoxin system PemK/MazF family toxin [Bryobacterales bacterium]|nr:type II toxin-antitoxin system PemK/MazF family toxin [Bryobacterales bacterium]